MSSGIRMQISLSHMQMKHIRDISKSKLPQINQVEVDDEVEDEVVVEELMINHH
jgi:hypothetical protein